MGIRLRQHWRHAQEQVLRLYTERRIRHADLTASRAVNPAGFSCSFLQECGLLANSSLRGCAGRSGSTVFNLARREKQKGPQGPFLFFWRRGWDSARSRRELPADRPLCGCVGRTGVDVRNHTRREKQKAPRGGLLSFCWWSEFCAEDALPTP